MKYADLLRDTTVPSYSGAVRQPVFKNPTRRELSGLASLEDLAVLVDPQGNVWAAANVFHADLCAIARQSDCLDLRVGYGQSNMVVCNDRYVDSQWVSSALAGAYYNLIKFLAPATQVIVLRYGKANEVFMLDGQAAQVAKEGKKAMYIKYPNFVRNDFSDGQILTWYHGTSTNFLSDIKENGLRPQNEVGHSMFTGTDAQTGHTDAVYLCVSDDDANGYAQEASKMFGGQPLLVEVTMPVDNSRMLMDEDALHSIPQSELDYGRSVGMSDWQMSAAVQGTIAYKGAIAPQYVTVVDDLTSEDNDTTLTTNSQQGFPRGYLDQRYNAITRLIKSGELIKQPVRGMDGQDHYVVKNPRSPRDYLMVVGGKMMTILIQQNGDVYVAAEQVFHQTIINTLRIEDGLHVRALDFNDIICMGDESVDEVKQYLQAAQLHLLNMGFKSKDTVITLGDDSMMTLDGNMVQDEGITV